MPISLLEARKNSRPVEVEFMGQTAIVHYKPTEFTGEAGLEIGEGTTREQAHAGARFLAKVLKSWEILGADNKPVPLEEGPILAEVPIPLIVAIFQKIQADMAPNPSS